MLQSLSDFDQSVRTSQQSIDTAQFIAAFGPTRGKERGESRRGEHAPERESGFIFPPFIVADGDVLVYVRLMFVE